MTTSYSYDAATILREVRGGATLKYVHGVGVDEPLAADDGTAASYFHADGLGSVAKLTSGSGAVTLARGYDAWGNLESGGSEPGYAFTGREWDPETRLYYYRARYYAADAGRFLSPDPRGFRDGPNPYSYVRNNAPNRVDPLGLTSCPSNCQCPSREWQLDTSTFGGAFVVGGAEGGGKLVCKDRMNVTKDVHVKCRWLGLFVGIGASTDVQFRGTAIAGPCNPADIPAFETSGWILSVGPATFGGDPWPTSFGLGVSIKGGIAWASCKVTPLP